MEILGPILDKVLPNHKLSKRRLNRETSKLAHRLENVFSSVYSPLAGNLQFDPIHDIAFNKAEVNDSLGGSWDMQYRHDWTRQRQTLQLDNETFYVDVVRQQPTANRLLNSQVTWAHLQVNESPRTFFGRSLPMDIPSKVADARMSVFLHNPNGKNTLEMANSRALKYMRRIVRDTEDHYPIREYVG